MRAMRAMVLECPRTPLRLVTREVPEPGAGEVLVKVAACGVCRTDLHVVDGDLTEPKLPIVPGHEIVGRIEAIGPGVARAGFEIGQRVGIPWLGRTCGHCFYCRSERENLCDEPGFTGYQIDGGYGDYALAGADYCFAIKGGWSDEEAAPLLCAGLIGHRALKMASEGAPDGRNLGIYGFGAAAHIVAQLARHEGREVYAFTRPGDVEAQGFAMALGASWAGGADEPAPEPLDAAILFAPVGALVPVALRAVRKGGIVVCAGIHMSDIPSFPYAILWGERVLRSVANLSRRDGREFLDLASRIPIRTHVETFPLTEANEALARLRDGRLIGAAVLVMDMNEEENANGHDTRA